MKPTQEQVLQWAREAGIDAEQDTLCRYEGWVEPMEKFATLAYGAGRKDENEACARVCDRFQERDVGMQPAECAGAIRARREQ